MLDSISPIVLLALAGSVLANISFVPYLIDIFRGKTRPHAVSWLIWTLTQGVGAAALWDGGATLAAVGITFTTVLVLGIFLLSFTRGSRKISPLDAIVLSLAVLALIGWMLLDHPVWAVLLASFIELLGFIPTYIKAYKDPATEHFPSWLLYFVGMALMLATLPEYTLLTTVYLATMTVASFVLIFILLLRRKK
jgi:hypothetical protein